MTAVVIFIVAGGLFLALLSRGEPRLFTQLAGTALAAHVVFAVAQYWVQESYYGVSDVHRFADSAMPLVRAMQVDFARFFPEVVKMGLHLDSSLPSQEFAAGDSNSTMTALTALTFFVADNSFLSSYVIVSVVMWAGSVLFAKALAAEVDDVERPVAYVAAMLVPSVAYWSSAIVKEGFVMAGLGVLCYSARRTVLLRELYLAPGMVVGALVVGLIKPYVLFPLVIAAAVWVLVARLNRGNGVATLRIGPLILATVLAVGGLLVMGRLFPEFAVDKMGERTASQQGIWSQVDYSSNSSAIELGDTTSSRSIVGQLPFVPLALANALFRPLLFEVRNATMFAASIESTVLTALVARILWRFRFGAVRAAVLRSPLLAASLAFVLSFGLAVGLTTLNLGSLSRYRLPMMPFYALCVGLLFERLRRRSEYPGASVRMDTGDVAPADTLSDGRNS